MCPDTA
ncbi:hypothetical protein D018_3075A, partial [Vibrio parahaemolyticus VP2007-007]